MLMRLKNTGIRRALASTPEPCRVRKTRPEATTGILAKLDTCFFTLRECYCRFHCHHHNVALTRLSLTILALPSQDPGRLELSDYQTVKDTLNPEP
eukprot:352652-Chlamydomonas_euryale.AAC.4